jgi:RimJ/RimL family protein N-acetyltransferase
MFRTTRLSIGLLEALDLEEVRLLHNQPETLKWLSDTHEVTEIEQERWFSNLMISSKSQRYVARELSSNKLVGVFRFDSFDPENKSVQVGLDVSVDFRRMGFAREIYTAMLPYFIYELDINRISLLTLETNFAARSLYESLGFVQEGNLREAFLRDFRYIDGILYSLLASEYRP